MTLYNFNPGQKSWKMYANTLTSISGDDLTITPVEGQDLVLEVSGNESDIILKHGDNNVLTIDESNATISGDLYVLGDISNTGTASLYDGAVTIGTTPDMLLVKSGTHTVFSIDISNRRVGIGKADPEEDLEIDGNIQLLSSKGNKIIFYDNSGQHEHCEIDALNDGINGGQLQFYTKIDSEGGLVTQKLTINNAGAIGLGPSPVDYGSSGQVLTSDGSNNIVKWRSPILIAGYINQDFSGTDSSDNIFGETNFTNESWATHSLDSLGEFVAPNDCVLFINYNLTINSLDASINSITLTLEKYDNSISTWNDYRVNKIVYDLSNILQQDSRSISTIVSLNTNDRIRLKYNISTYGTNYNIVGGNSNIGHSYVSGYSIMNK